MRHAGDMLFVRQSCSFKAMKRLLFCLLLAALSLSCFACASQKPLLAPSTVPDAAFVAADSLLEEAHSFYTAQDYARGVELLRSVGQQGDGYYRMDDVLYWIGMCRHMLGDPVRAARAFSMLKRYYPLSDVKFQDLQYIMQAVQDSLSRHPELAPVRTPTEGTHRVELADANTRATDNANDQPRVTNVFYETDIRQAIADIAAQTGTSIVPDAFVSGYVTVEFQDIPLEAALERLVTPLGLSYRRIQDYYLVGSPSADSPSFALLTTTKTVRPRYLTCQEVKTLLPTVYNQYLSLDSKGNALTITAPSSIIQKFEEDLAEIDRPRTQIMIEAMVVELSTEAKRSLGMDWSWLGREGAGTYRIAKFLPSGLDSSFVGEFLKVKEAFDLQVALRALAAQGKARIRANPRVATIDGHEAEIRIAKEAYFSLVQGSVNFPYFSLEKIPTGITLKITPHVGESSEIITDIFAEVSDAVGTALNELPVTNVRTVNTRIRVMNGETIGIGGLVSESEHQETNRVPFLGDIPVLGALFGHTATVKEESEIVILIIPHILISPIELGML